MLVNLAASCYGTSSGVLAIIAVSSAMSAGIDAVVVAPPLMRLESRLFWGYRTLRVAARAMFRLSGAGKSVF